jgi:hypothetical protein
LSEAIIDFFLSASVFRQRFMNSGKKESGENAAVTGRIKDTRAVGVFDPLPEGVDINGHGPSAITSLGWIHGRVILHWNGTIRPFNGKTKLAC